MGARPKGPRLPRKCECGGKMGYVFEFGMVWAWCEACTPVVAALAPFAPLSTNTAVSHPEPGAMRSERSERATSLLPAKEGE